MVSRWRRRKLAAAVELLLLAAAAWMLFCLGSWVGEPIPSLVTADRPECADVEVRGSAVVRLELAVPGDGTDAALTTLDELLACADRVAVGQGLKESTKRDFVFIPIYVALLAWCCARLGGLRFWRFWTDATAEDPALVDPEEQYRRIVTAARMQEARGRRTASEAHGWRLRRRADRRERFAALRIERDQTIALAKAARDQALASRPSEQVGNVQRFLRWLKARLTPDGFGLAPVDRNERGRLIAQVAGWSVVVAGLLDVGENLLLLETARDLTTHSPVDDTVVALTAGLAAAKFILVVLPIASGLALVWLLALAMVRSKVADHTPNQVVLPPPDSDERRWAVPVASAGALSAVPVPPGEDYGICLSGGGIRSATFALGALQVLEDIGPAPAGRAKWHVGQARWLSAVSGGSYLAAAYQFLAKGGGSASPLADASDAGVAPNTARRALERMSSWHLVGVTTSRIYIATLPRSQPGDDDADPPGAPATPLVPRAGPVEDHLRRHSTHLADGAAEWLLALGEVAIKAFSGLVVLLLVIWSVAVPLGWAFQYVLHGLDGTDPTPRLEIRTVAGVGAAFLAFVTLRLVVSGLDLIGVGGGAEAKRRKDQGRAATTAGIVLLAVTVVGIPFVAANVVDGVSTVSDWLGVTSEPAPEPDLAEIGSQLDAIAAGTSKAASGAAEAAQIAGIDAEEELAASAGSAELAAAQAREAVAALARGIDDDDEGDDDRVKAAPITVRFDPETCAPVPDPDPGAIDPDASLSVVARACEAATLSAVVAEKVSAIADGVPRANDPAEAGRPDTAKLAAAAARTVEGANEATAALRKLAAEVDDSEPSGGSDPNPPVQWAGLAAVITAIGGWRAKRNLDVAKGGPTKGPSSAAGRIVRSLGFGGLSEVVAGIAVGALAIVALSDVVVDAWRRGFDDELRLVVTAPAWLWWLGAVVMLVVITARTNVNNWSLRPFYHRRLWLPYAVLPSGSTAPWETDTRLSEVGARIEGTVNYPELLICAAAQTSGREWAPPGRRAVSFVFSASAVGGPEVGYVRTRTLEAMLGRRHRKTITLFGAVALSGAAFGPAMGRQSKGGLGSVMALANARLGAWLPNPHHLAELAEVRSAGLPVRAGSFARWPRLWYWFMEIVGQYPPDAKVLLTSDGGHVENLGLVELLRRRCKRILCFDASGAGATPTTLAEAIVMAREELGVEIVLLDDSAPTGIVDPALVASGSLVAGDDGLSLEFEVAGDDPVPRPLIEAGKFGADPLGRKASVVASLAARIAARSVLVAEIRYPAVGAIPASTGHLVYGTLALAADGPDGWDVLEYAHRHDIFPNDGTERQWFDAPTFSAYQQLGRLTAKRMVDEAVARGI